MSMEKFGIGDDELMVELRNEEATLMSKVSSHMARSDKTAAEDNEFQRTQNRLAMIRSKITEHDLKKGQPQG